MVKINKRSLGLILFAISIILLTVAAVEKYILTPSTLRIVDLESTFLDYEVKDQKVYMKYYITMDNPFLEDKTVKLTALFSDDVANGLLKNEALGAPSEYVIPAKSRAGYEIIFEGDFAGTFEKSSKKLPEIEIEILPE